MKLEFDYDDLWQQYFQAARSRRASFHMYRSGDAIFDELEYSRESKVVRDVCKLCAKSYADSLGLFPEQDWSSLYIEDMKNAAGEDDVDMLEVLFDVHRYCKITIPVEVEEFWISYFVNFFKRVTDPYDVSRIQELFKRVIAYSEPCLDIYTWAIGEMFSMGKDPAWFTQFYWGLYDLLHRAPKNQETLLAMQKGLIGTGQAIKKAIEDIIAYAYENRREIVVSGVQGEGIHVTALMYFQDGIAPEIGMTLNNNETICRIDNFEELDGGGPVYRCYVTVTYGELTPLSTFEIQL